MDNEETNAAAATETDGTQTEETETETESTTFDQAEVDRRVEQALATQDAKHKAEMDKLLKETAQKAKNEGEKLAKMSAKEKADAEAKEREDALTAREAALNKRELHATVLDTLAKNELPADLADALVELGDADAISKTIGTFKTVVDARVADGIKAGMRQDSPKTGASSLGDTSDPFVLAEARYKQKKG